MARELQPGDYIVITYKPMRYRITGITDNAINFDTKYGGDEAVLLNGQYVVEDADTVTFEAGEPLPVAPLPVPAPTVPRPFQAPVPVPQPAYRAPFTAKPPIPQPTIPRPGFPQPAKPAALLPTYPQPVQPAYAMPMYGQAAPAVPKTPRKVPNVPLPPLIQERQTGTVSGPGAQYQEDGDPVRNAGNYRFTAIRSLRNGTNVIIQLEDGSNLTLRWHDLGKDRGHGWTVRVRDPYGRKTAPHEVINVTLDQ